MAIATGICRPEDWARPQSRAIARIGFSPAERGEGSGARGRVTGTGGGVALGLLVYGGPVWGGGLGGWQGGSVVELDRWEQGFDRGVICLGVGWC